MKTAVEHSLKEFKFFYEDTERDEIKNAEKEYQPRLKLMTQEFRQVAVKADSILDEETVNEIRELSGQLENVSNTQIHTSLGGPISRELLRRNMEPPYHKYQYALEEVQ